MKKIIMLSLMAASAIMADPLVSYPGTKAKGMGGAFTAIANNNSAMYFNPAGMVNFESDKANVMFTAEVGTGGAFDLSADNIEDVTSSTFNYFVGGGITAPEYGYGVAVYSLYSVKALATDSRGTTSYKDQDISALSASYAHALPFGLNDIYPGGGRISIGATLGVAFSGGGLIEVESTSSDGSTSTSNYDDDTLDQLGYFGSVGIKARLYDSMLFKLDVAANYRSSAELDSVHDDDGTTSAPVNGMDMPAEVAFGVAAIYQTEYGVVTLAGDQKLTSYEDATSSENSDLHFRLNDYQTTSIGLDLSGPVYQVRGGVYTSQEQDGNNGENLDIAGMTFGAGMILKNGSNIEFSVDNRTYKWASGDETSEVFASVSLNIAVQTRAK